MTRRSSILVFALFCAWCVSTVLNADNHDGETRFQQELEESDMEALRDFINAKRQIPLEDKLSNLRISGDVRLRSFYIKQKALGQDLTGSDGVYVFREEQIINDEIFLIGERLRISHYFYDIQFDLHLDYASDYSWAVAHLTYDNAPGVDDNGLDTTIDPEGYHGSGSCNNRCLKQAYMGYNLYSDDYSWLDIEVGRRGQLWYVFDSQIQFLSRLDGILLSYWRSWEWCSWTYGKVAGFVVDERASQNISWAAEIGFLNIARTGIDFKYSFIDWVLHGRNRFFVQDPIGMQFLNSQFTLAYNFTAPWTCLPATFYGAFLWNHSPALKTFTQQIEIDIPRKNIGWYTGLRIGEICKEGDWSVDIFYAVVQAQCMPDNDVRRIGRGNVLDESFTADARGNTNWKGWQVMYAFALTDNFVINTWVERSEAEDKNIGGSNTYICALFETVYAF